MNLFIRATKLIWPAGFGGAAVGSAFTAGAMGFKVALVNYVLVCFIMYAIAMLTLMLSDWNRPNA